MKELLNYSLFSFQNKDITTLNILISILSISLLVYLYRKANRLLMPRLSLSHKFSDDTKTQLSKRLQWLMISLIAIILVFTLGLDYSFSFGNSYSISVLLLLRALVVWLIIMVFDWIINNLFQDYYYPSEKASVSETFVQEKTKQVKRKTLQYIFALSVIIFIIRNFGLEWTVNSTTIGDKTVSLNLSSLFEAAQTIFIAQLIVWALQHLVLLKIYERRNIDIGSQFALNQLIKYLIYTYAIIHALGVLGINVTILLGGAAALLVVIGLGLQQTFSDFVSGIVLLFERAVSVGDVLEFDNTVGVVEKIGLRSSTLQTRDNVSMIVPNHLLVNDKVTNWTHHDDYIRFTINLSVAYGSDTQLVQRLLIKSAEQNQFVLKEPKPFIRFNDFGESSLSFILYFFSKEYIAIEDVKSDLRLSIDKLFRENKVIVPFPQREIRILNKD